MWCLLSSVCLMELVPKSTGSPEIQDRGFLWRSNRMRVFDRAVRGSYLARKNAGSTSIDARASLGPPPAVATIIAISSAHLLSALFASAKRSMSRQLQNHRLRSLRLIAVMGFFVRSAGAEKQAKGGNKNRYKKTTK